MWSNWKSDLKPEDVVIPKRLLWDQDLNDFDYQENCKIVVQRVIEDGLPEDYNLIFAMYGGIQGVREIIKEVHHFRYPQDIAFVCIAFDLKKEELGCYKRQQLRQRDLLN